MMTNTTKPSRSSLSSYADLLDELAFLRRQVKELAEDKNFLEEQIRHLKHLRFDRSSEVAPSGQQTLFDEAEATVEEAADAPKAGTGKKKKNRGRPVRKPLPDNLPEVHKTIDLAEGEKFCPLSGWALKAMGEETSKQLDIEPTRAKVIVTHRLKYSCDCAACKAAAGTPTMRTAPVELQPIPKAIAAPGLLAYIAVSKYADALPLARQEQMFKRYDIHLSRATMASWMIALGKLVMPLINLARDELLKCLVIQADETRIQVHKGTGKRPTADSYMWVFLGEGPNDSKIVLYELGPSRSHLVPLRVLDGYNGYLHTDGYEAYETLAAKVKGITLVGDWAHVRRIFDEAVKAVGKDFKGEIKAQVGLNLINELFRIDREDIEANAPLERRLQIRREKSVPIIKSLKKWADETAPTIPPKSLSGAAVRYMLQRWEKLIIFLEDPILRLDTNPVEGVIRPFVVGRNNWMFADTVKDAESSAALYSLIVMTRSAGINPFLYFKDIFTRLPKAQSLAEIESMLPWQWKQETS